MRLVRDLHHKNLSQGSAVTIGNFDALHAGHAHLVNRVLTHARRDSLDACVVSFEPLAGEFFSRGAAPARLHSASERLRWFKAAGLDLVWLMRFGEELVGWGAQEFVERVLVRGLSARTVVVGEDFRFGRGREGDVARLRELGEGFGFAVEVPATVVREGERASSSAVRDSLAEADFARAGTLLERPYRMYGRVVRGRQLGRKLGYPTANIRLHRRRSPLHGIYAVRVSGAGLTDHPAVASVGCRPTVEGDEFLLEVHLFDFDGDLYGRHLDVAFVAKLREEEKFATLAALTRQMDDDAARARALLAA